MLSNFYKNLSSDTVGSFDGGHIEASDGGGDHSIGAISGLQMMSLRDFIRLYGEQLKDYYNDDSFIMNSSYDSGDFEINNSCLILCMVDREIYPQEAYIPKQSVRSSIRRSGVEKRRKIRHRYSYLNPMNRIHGFVILKNTSSVVHSEKRILCISTICSSQFSDFKGIGSDMMKSVINISKNVGYNDVILSVANNYAYNDENLEENSEDSEEDPEEDSEEWIPTEDVIDIISHELWRKIMRKDENEVPYYNIDEDYVYEEVQSYLLNIEENEQYSSNRDCNYGDEPGQYEYGGFWYLKGKVSQLPLMRFYEKFGFREDPEVYLHWGCFEIHPFPSMRLTL